MRRRLSNIASAILAACAILAAVIWFFSRLIGDPNVPAQFVLWTPTWAFVCADIGFVGASWCMAKLAGRSTAGPGAVADSRLRRPAFSALRRGALVAAGLLTGFMLIIDWRMANAIFGPAPAPRTQTLRVMNWNPTAMFMEPFADVVASVDADLALIANPPAIVDWTRVRDHFEPGRDAVRHRRFAVVSRYRVLRWGWTDLMVRGSEPVLQSTHKASWLTIDTGQAMWIELDTTKALGRPIVVWIVDMPSEPMTPRRRAFDTAARSVREWTGPAMERSSIDAEAPMSQEAFVARFGGSGFPEPDLIVGDFNTPRGGPSIRTLVPVTMRSAFAQAGYGPMGTWPRDAALLGIDQAFTAEWLRATRYDVRDPELGAHRFQVIEIAPKSAP